MRGGLQGGGGLLYGGTRLGMGDEAGVELEDGGVAVAGDSVQSECSLWRKFGSRGWMANAGICGRLSGVAGGDGD